MPEWAEVKRSPIYAPKDWDVHNWSYLFHRLSEIWHKAFKSLKILPSPAREIASEPLLAVAACMAGKNAFGEPRNVAFYDEGERNYRLVMTDPARRPSPTTSS